MNAMTDLASVADELYSLPANEFVTARNASVKAARDAGNKDLAARIGELTKPSAAAWAVNMLVRHSADQVSELIKLGASLRKAQAELDPAQLRDLTRQRQKLVAALGTKARSVAEEFGKRPSDSAIEEVEQTLQAALADTDAAIAVQTGRLVRTLAGTGWEPVDLSGAVAVPPEGMGAIGQEVTDESVLADNSPPEARTTKTEKKKSASAKDRESERERREAREIREEAALAAREVDAARSDLEDIEGEIEDLSTRREQIVKELDSARERVAALEKESSDLNRDKRGLERDRTAAMRVLERAERRARARTAG